MSPAGARRVAAIDCGTNSLRLLIADISPAKNSLVDLDRRMEIVRLGQGVDATGKLAPEALARTFRVLEQYARTINDSGASAVRLVATSATRDASNAGEFTAGVRRILGVDPEVISGAEEAQLSFSGATAELGGRSRPGAATERSHPHGTTGQPGDTTSEPGDTAGEQGEPRPPEPTFLVVDIGGGSTEFVTPDEDSPGGLAAISMNIGCVRLTERHLHDDPPSAQQIAAATADIDAALATVAEAIPLTRARTLVGLAGSITTLTALSLDLTTYDPVAVHHARISAERVHDVTVGLLSKPHAERAALAVIHPGRVDVIGAGALIADRVMNRFGFAEMVASEHDILDGIAWSLADRGTGPSWRT
jgi:exopolyphosphatase / guanosine-5'-triphosphate,3'-diphosphate pyrophosphatase